MLETVKSYLSVDEYSFEELFADYVLDIQQTLSDLELEFVKRHNKIDVLNLNRWVESYIQKEVKR